MLVPLAALRLASAATLGVCPSGACDYDTIGKAVAAASEGDVVEITEVGTIAERVTVDIGIEIANVSGGVVVWTNDADEADHALLVTSTSLVTVRDVQFGDLLDGLGRRIRVDPQAKLQLVGGAVHGGTASSGGGVYIYDTGTLSVEGTEFLGNAASNYGGAIKAAFGASVHLAAAIFTDNQAPYGGAIAADSATVTDVGSAFFGNDAAEEGGSIYSSGGSLDLGGSVFTDGSSAYGGGDVWAYLVQPAVLDGTVHEGAESDLLWGGAIAATWGTLKVTNGTFIDNDAWAAAGAIEADFVASVEIRDSVFIGNGAGTGGALYFYGSTGPSGPVEVSGCTFEGNDADSRGGAIEFESAGQPDIHLSITTSTFRENTARWGGGVAAVNAAGLVVTDSRFEDNNVVAEGGGLYVSEVGDVVVDRVHLCRNIASVTGGGALFDQVDTVSVAHLVAVDNDANQGGAVHLYDADAAVIDHATFVANRATGGGAAVAAFNSTLALSHAAVTDSVGMAMTAPAALSDATVVHDLWWNNADGDANVSLPGDELFADPQFRSLAAGVDCGLDLRPADDSPLVDAGALAPTELDGTAQDIGAYGGLGSFGDLPTDVDADGDGFVASEDCDDFDANAHPGAVELCDDRDLDCNGLSGRDQGGVEAWADLDGDGFGDPSVSVSTCSEAPWASNGLDCNDQDGNIHPDALETWYDGVDADCRGDDDFDADLDGFAKAGALPSGTDCNDDDPAIHPAAEDSTADDVDQDCDGAAAAVGLAGGGGCSGCDAAGGIGGWPALLLAFALRRSRR